MNTSIGNILLHLPAHKLQLVSALRDTIRFSNPHIEEIIKWGRITFVTRKTDIAFICSCPGAGYVELGFFKATSLTDPKGLFEGKGKEIRRIKIHSADTLPAAQIGRWINEAARLASR